MSYPIALFAMVLGSAPIAQSPALAPGDSTGCTRRAAEARWIPADTESVGAAPRALSKSGPIYPDGFYRDTLASSVIVNFAVDTTGTVIPGSILILHESRSEFGDAACKFLAETRFEVWRREGRPLVVSVSGLAFVFNSMGTIRLQRPRKP